MNSELDWSHDMRKAVYIGAVETLHGKTALIRWHGAPPGSMKVQFDDLTLGPDYAIGWHLYPETDFHLLQDK